MGIVVLAAIETIGELPHHYFQAVGSGTGAIAAWEAAQRLMADERFSSCNMTLHLSQNLPFTPMFDAWKQNSRTLLNVEESIQKTMLRTIRAQVLSNRQPPYSIIGGVFDILQDSRGYFYAVTNKEAIRAGKLFLAKEGCDLDPAAEITLASLIQAIEMGRVDKKALVLLNITGGGYSCLQQDKHIDYLKPDINLAPENWQVPQLADDLIQRLQSE